IRALYLLAVLLLLVAAPIFLPVLMTNQGLCRVAGSEYDEQDFGRLVAFLRGAPDGRFIARPELGFTQPYFESLLPIYTSHDSFSTSSMGSQDNLAFFYTQYFGLQNPAAYDLFNVKYALVPSDREKPYSFYNQEFVSGNYTLYSIPTAGFFDLVDSRTALVYNSAMNTHYVRSVNAAWLNTHAMEMGDHITMFRQDQTFNPESYDMVIDERTDPLMYDGWTAGFDAHEIEALPDCGTILNENRTLNEYVATVLTDRPCLLLFKMSYHPAWQAKVNGAVKPVYAVSPSFMAVRLSEGLQAAEFEYLYDSTFKFWLIFLAVILLAGLLVYDLKICRKHGSRNSRKKPLKR
ncbi:hypothetical protein KY362_01940, partial [Candidatus Woesearchaeota archaeon]|nr:hypothetical protein [Candidatus Woesearchaeota archaeon]